MENQLDQLMKEVESRVRYLDPEIPEQEDELNKLQELQKDLDRAHTTLLEYQKLTLTTA